MSMELVKLLYDSQSVLPNDKDFYEHALEDIEHDGISSQVYFLLEQQGRLQQTPSFFQARLKGNYERGLYQNIFIKNQTDLILKRFELEGLNVIALKGVYFAEKHFGHIGARITSDIDLLIKYHDLEKAIDSVKSLGFVMEEEVLPGHFHCSLSKELPQSRIPLVVELHWSLIKENTSKFAIEDIWRQATPVRQYEQIKELSLQHTFYMILLHGWRHNLDSPKYFIDIIQVMSKMKENDNFEMLFKLAELHKTLKRISRTLMSVYQQFPQLNDLKKLPINCSTKSWEYQSKKGLKKYIKFIDYKFFSFDRNKDSFIEVFRWIWPSKIDAHSQLGDKNYNRPFLKLYIALYKDRFSRVLKGRNFFKL